MEVIAAAIECEHFKTVFGIGTQVDTKRATTLTTRISPIHVLLRINIYSR